MFDLAIMSVDKLGGKRPKTFASYVCKQVKGLDTVIVCMTIFFIDIGYNAYIEMSP